MRVFLAIAGILLAARPAWAQCGAKQPQCAACHQAGTEGAPACDGGRPWHRDHAFASLCTECHGGDPDATGIGAAHAGLAWPLVGEGARCEVCHPGKGRALAPQYLSARAPAPHAPRTSHAGDAILAGLAVLLAAGGAAYVVHNERRR